MSDGRNLIVGIAGRRGTGKSTLARRLLERCWRLLIWDPMGEHTWCPNRLDSVEDLECFMAWAGGRDRFAARYVPEGDLAEEFAPVAEIVYDYGRLVFAIEEVAMLCSPSALPYELDRLVRLGRHRSVSLIWTAQRMVEVARRLTAATDYFILFKHTEPRDLDGIAQRCGSRVADWVSELSVHGCLIWNALEAERSDFKEVLLALSPELSQRLSQGRVVTMPRVH